MPKIVCVEWEDAVTHTGYYDKDHPERFKPVLCKTVGHLIRRGRKEVVLAGESFSDGDRRHIHTIPRGMVRKITYLKGE